MNTALAPAVRKKHILLVVSDDVRRDLRARVLRKLGTDVECAADISEARSLWRADTYNLVPLDVVRDAQNLEEFCAEIKAAKPPQAVAFLVGKPELYRRLSASRRGGRARTQQRPCRLGKSGGLSVCQCLRGPFTPMGLSRSCMADCCRALDEGSFPQSATGCHKIVGSRLRKAVGPVLG